MNRALSKTFSKRSSTAFNLLSGISLAHSRLDQHRPVIIARLRLARRWKHTERHATLLSDAQRSTIYALSTPPGKAGVAVIRVSGPETELVRTRLLPKSATNPPEPWRMERCRIRHPETGEVLDDGLAVFFKGEQLNIPEMNESFTPGAGPKSFTTEDVLELHIHSGRAVISSVLGALSALPFCRPAEPGEFTRRAFRGGRLDLTQVEGLKDLIDAETDGQRRMALRAAEGATRVLFEDIRQEIIGCLAHVEALIDFGEGEDIEEGVYEQARQRAAVLLERIRAYLRDSRRGEILRTGLHLTIFGPPNAGKSSLLNFLAQREAAIVTPVPGTTRDILQLAIDIGGIPVIVSDTAGLRPTDDLVERIGIERAQTASVPFLFSCPRLLTSAKNSVSRHLASLITEDTLFLYNKLDLHPDVSGLKLGPKQWAVSLRTGRGTENFLASFAQAIREKYNVEDDSHAPVITHARHRTHLESAANFIDAFLETSVNDIVLGAEELRYAAKAVGKISGHIDVEDILDALFSDFCIGK
ncbi:unnamed protein product [Mycena citricolor]|uniref:tRNA modification GTPase TrmE n=1 Tax=Mycena citricolor TaxID=2018698 RepID=A0AAD2Q4R4_9AGAR|nr:unnamed protein product [Mycena citricolor]